MPEATVDGVHAKSVIVGAGATVIVADAELPSALAVIFAVWSVETAAIVTVKLAAGAPAGTVTEGGTLTLTASDTSAIAVACVAATLNITVH